MPRDTRELRNLVDEVSRLNRNLSGRQQIADRLEDIQKTLEEINEKMSSQGGD